MTTAVQNNSCGFINFCQNETSNLFAKCPSSSILLEIIRRVAVIASIIIPLIGLIANCVTTKNLSADLIVPHSRQATLTGSVKQRLEIKLPILSKLVSDFRHDTRSNPEERSLAYEEILRGSRLDPLLLEDKSRITPITLFENIIAELEIEDGIIVVAEHVNVQNARRFAQVSTNENNQSGVKIWVSGDWHEVSGFYPSYQPGFALWIKSDSDLPRKNEVFQGSPDISLETSGDPLQTAIQLLAHL